MAPKKPRATVPSPAGALYDVPAVQRYKTVQQTQTPRTRGGSGQNYRAAVAPTPAIRQRGSAFGGYAPETEDPGIARFPSIDPTSTSNPARPRTLQAGYHKERGAQAGTLRVRFRDGTPWEYYDVPPSVWRNFRRVKSPGRFINRVLNQYNYGRGDF